MPMADSNPTDALHAPGVADGRVEPAVTPRFSHAAAALLAACVVLGGAGAVGLARRTTPADALPRRPAAYRVDLNTADLGHIRILPGVGAAMAGRIIERRQTRPFESAEDLLEVKGIGPKTLRRILPFITQPSRAAATTTSMDEETEDDG